MADWPLIAVRWALFADLGLLFGLPLFAAYALRGAERERLLPLRRLMIGLAVLGLAASVYGFLLTAANMLGVSIGFVDRATVEMLLGESNLGWALIARIIALVVILVGAVFLRKIGGAVLLGMIILGAGALASLAWSSHGAASEGALGWLHLASDIMHLLAASAWIGALAAFVLIFVQRKDDDRGDLPLAHRALAGFAGAGTLLVALIVLSGLVNGLILVGFDNVGELGTSLYGQLLVIKLVLFGGMLVLAASNRFRLTPALEAVLAADQTRSATARLRRSLWLEAGAGIAILALVAWFGTLEPPTAMG